MIMIIALMSITQAVIAMANIMKRGIGKLGTSSGGS